jgi:heme-degrading monooxygenase HmoA
MADRMLELAGQQPGFIGVESVRGSDGFGITVSYWESLESIRNWKHHSEHLTAQAVGQQTWYSDFELRVCQVLRANAMHSDIATKPIETS